MVQGIAQMQALQPQVVIGFGGGSAMDADAVICGQRVTQGIQQRRARQKTIADYPDVLIGKALEHRQAALTAVQPRL
ncbi:hypothetical protein L246_10035 [Salmonella enterica subsp. enterica serovar Worthington str. BCH-5715]|nr:hypothetical protein L246_10035 [Salmonella enterica subsp. enterica serovar Worthington str. BCH-5715]